MGGDFLIIFAAINNQNLFSMKKVLFLLFMVAVFSACSKDDDVNNDNDKNNPPELPSEPTEIPVDSIEINNDSVKLYIEQILEIRCDIFPQNTTDPKVIEWYSNDDDIIGIDTAGNKCKIKGLKDGETFIVAKLKSNQDISDTCYVNILPIPASSIELEKESMEMYVGDDSLLAAKILPDNATYRELEWSSSNEDIATVNDGIVTGISAGDAVITVRSKKDDVKAECHVKVKNVLVSDILINELSDNKLFMINEELQLTASIFPENAFNKNFEITSSDNSIVRIDENNKLYALSKGKCVITIASEDSGASRSYNVGVGDITSFVSLTISGSYSNVFGYVTGEIYCSLRNNSDYAIKITSLTVLDGNGNTLKTASDNLLGTIQPHTSSNGLGGRFNQNYYPKFVWEYEYSGQTYQAIYDFKDR